MHYRIHRHRILCINKNQRRDPREQISHIGGQRADGGIWKLSVGIAIEGLETGNWEFYVVVDGREIDVTVGVTERGKKYLCTEVDPEGLDYLHSLPECRQTKRGNEHSSHSRANRVREETAGWDVAGIELSPLPTR